MHDLWVEFKATNAKARHQLKATYETFSAKGSSAENESLPSNKEKALKHKPGLRAAFMTEAGLSDSQLDEIWKKHRPGN